MGSAKLSQQERLDGGRRLRCKQHDIASEGVCPSFVDTVKRRQTMQSSAERHMPSQGYLNRRQSGFDNSRTRRLRPTDYEDVRVLQGQDVSV